MATASVTTDFQPLTDILSSEVDTNFQDLVQFLNGQVIHKDGSVAATGHLSGPATDPVSDNQYARKRYVDRIQQNGSAAFTLVSGGSNPSAQAGSVVFPIAFTAAPRVMLTVQIGGNIDVLPNITAAPTTTGFSWRVFTAKDQSSSTASGTLHWFAFGRH